MKKEEACKKLGIKKQDLANLLDITPSYLSKIELTAHHVSIVEGEIAKRELVLTLGNNARLTSKCLELQEQIDNIVRALDV